MGIVGTLLETATYLGQRPASAVVAGNRNDQLYRAAGRASDEEIQRRQQATTYRYHFSIGLSYTFGSIFNNVVNTRF